MVMLRSLRSYTVASWTEVSSALIWLERAAQDAISDLQRIPATITLSPNTELKSNRRHVGAAGTYQLPSAKTDGDWIQVTNTNAAGASTLRARSGETVRGVASYSLAARGTIRFWADGKGGWWG